MNNLDSRLKLFWKELKTQASALNASEFEYFVEMWGVMWMPWFIEIEGNSLRFTANDISDNDLEVLIEKGLIELIKEYKTSEINFEIGRQRYRIVQSQIV